MHITLNTVSVNRDAMTKLPVTVPAHEVEIVKTVFGEDNVAFLEQDAGSVELDPAEEGSRLASKYGEAAVKAVYGENFKGAVARACSSHEVAAKPKGKALAPA
jgi:hypothetical protein